MKKLSTLVFVTLLALVFYWTKSKSPTAENAAWTLPVKKIENASGNVISIHASPSLPKVQPPSVSSGTPDPIGRIREFSSHVMLSETEKAQMNELLAQREVQEKIKDALLNPALLEDRHFTERAAVLDVLYEGLKSKNGQVASRYNDLAEELLSAEAPSEVKRNKKAIEQYFGDRVEIAMVVGSLSQDQWESLRLRTKALNPAADKIFAQAKRIQSAYRVSL